MKTFVSIAAAVAIASGAAQAQNADKGPQIVEHDVVKIAGPGEAKENVMFERKVFMTGPDAVEFVSTEASIAGKTVKGAPYSAEAVTESTQTLADGNRIVSKSSATTYRDSEGRTRREMTLSMPGMPDPPAFITINDPVAGVSYHLETRAKIARKMHVVPDGVSFGIASAPAMRIMRAPAEGAPEAGAAVGGAVTVHRSAMPLGHVVPDGGPVRVRSGSMGEPKTESLGKRAIDGVQAEGSRSTVTIPAGTMGNERDIHIVTERWYSPELQTVIQSKHSDPRVGETTYTLTNIQRSDPHPSLFQVPSDYTIANDEVGPGVRVMRKIERK